MYPNGNHQIDCYGEQPRGSDAPHEPTCTGYACEIHSERERMRSSCVVDSGPFALREYGFVNLTSFPNNQFCMFDPHGNRSNLICYCNGEAFCNNASLIEWGQNQFAANQTSIQCWSSDFIGRHNETLTQVQGHYCVRSSASFTNQTVIEAFYGSLESAPHGASFLKLSLGCRTIHGMILNRTEEHCLCQYDLCNAPGSQPTAATTITATTPTPTPTPTPTRGIGIRERIAGIKLVVVLQIVLLLYLL